MKTTLKRLRQSQPMNWIATSAARWTLRSLGRGSEFLIKHLPRTGTVRCRLPNGKFLTLCSDGDDWVSNQLFWRGWDGYEPETVRIFCRLATSARVIFDVGAHVGLYSLLGALNNADAAIYAFEPLPATYERLVRHLNLNHARNVRCFRAAVGESDGQAKLFYYVSEDIPCSASLSYSFMEPTGPPEYVEVSVSTIDGVAAKDGLSQIDIIKLDTEGTEAEILRGARTILERDHPAILCEVLPKRGTERELQNILGPLGYGYYLLTPEGPVRKEQIDGHRVYRNYLFIGANCSWIIP